MYGLKCQNIPRAVPHEQVANDPVLQIVIIVSFCLLGLRLIIWKKVVATRFEIFTSKMHKYDIFNHLLISIPNKSSVFVLLVIVQLQNHILYTKSLFLLELERSSLNLSNFSSTLPSCSAASTISFKALERFIAVGRDASR